MKKAIVFGMTLATILFMCACQGKTDKSVILTETDSLKEAVPQARIPMVMVKGELYYDTGKKSDAEGRCGVMDGEIISAVDATQIPTEDNQSNFGAGYGYQFGAGDTIEIQMEDGEWYVYEKGSGEGKIRFNDIWYDKGYLSEETLEWLYWYNGLTEEEQMAISMVPAELVNADALAKTAETNADTEEEKDTAANSAEEIQIALVKMENPSWDYYIYEPSESDTQAFGLSVLEMKTNQITDTDEWFAENELNLEADSSDEEYSCRISQDGLVLHILKEGQVIAELDFCEFQYSDDFNEVDRAYIDQPIWHAAVKDNVLYVSTFHYTYTASAPSSGYITAIDMDDYHVIWKSAPQVCNSRNFWIEDDVIFCGYGFTSEPDYLYQLDRETGVVIAREDLKSMADYVIGKDDKLYVRTYNTDYVFQIEN